MPHTRKEILAIGREVVSKTLGEQGKQVGPYKVFVRFGSGDNLGTASIEERPFAKPYIRQDALPIWSDSVAKEMFIKALERAVEQNKKGYELTDCDKHSWWEDFKAYSEINPAVWSERHIADVFEKVGLAKIVREQGNDALTDAVQSAMIELSKTKPAEWSEEDKAKKERLISIVKRALHGNEYPFLNDNGATELITWLKSLHPRPHWKPSEDQLDALMEVLAERNIQDKKDLATILNDLWLELKKL